MALILTLSLFGTALVVGGYYYVKIYPRMKRLEDPYWGNEPSRQKSLDADTNPGGEFDLKLYLPGGPYGIAWDGSQFIVCNRNDPWGLMRIRAGSDGEWTVQMVPVIETTYAQRMSLDGITWNGENFVGLAMGSWFQLKDETVFVVLDPQSLRITRTVSAPAKLGAITFDGTKYWAATRNNTETSGETPKLFELDRDFAVIAEHEPPSVGCQGLAWDGRYLWFTDVFNDSISVLDVSEGTPKVVKRWSGAIQYPSGLAFDGTTIWLCDYGDNALWRLKRTTMTAWTGNTPREKELAPPGIAPPAADDADVTALRKKLRSDDWVERMHAESALRERGLGIDYDRREESTPDPPSPSKIDLDDFILEIRGDELVASWNAFIGENYISSATESTTGIVSMPLFARYSVTVRSSALPAPIEKEYTARPGLNVERDVVLVDGLRPGKYSASFFIHVQYVDKKEGAKILNLNEASLEVEKK